MAKKQVNKRMTRVGSTKKSLTQIELKVIL